MSKRYVQVGPRRVSVHANYATDRNCVGFDGRRVRVIIPIPPNCEVLIEENGIQYVLVFVLGHTTIRLDGVYEIETVSGVLVRRTTTYVPDLTLLEVLKQEIMRKRKAQDRILQEEILVMTPIMEEMGWKPHRFRRKNIMNFTDTQEVAAKALVQECVRRGITNQNLQAAILAIISGESNLNYQAKELYNYSPSRLKEVFPKATTAIIDTWAWAQKKGISRELFFGFFYGPNFRGPNFLGNRDAEDAGKFYGRSFLQLTGRSNYDIFGRRLHIPLVGNPDLLCDDLDVACKVAIDYFVQRIEARCAKEKVKFADWVQRFDDRYFDTLLAMVGNNPANIKKKKTDNYHLYKSNIKEWAGETAS